MKSYRKKQRLLSKLGTVLTTSYANRQDVAAEKLRRLYAQVYFCECPIELRSLGQMVTRRLRYA